MYGVKCIDLVSLGAFPGRLFEVICPSDEFLPKAPDPEDLVWDDGSPLGDDVLEDYLAAANARVAQSQ